MTVRLATQADLVGLPALERAAGVLFAEHDMADVANGELPTVEELSVYQQAGRAWVKVDGGTGEVAGYAIAETVEGCGHLEQVSCHPDYAGRGYGRELIGAVTEWTRQEKLPAVTLTTFVAVPWNGPYYERLGFRFLGDDELTPGLRAIREHEASLGLDRWPRAAMRREL